MAAENNPSIFPNNFDDPIKEESQESDNDENVIWQKTYRSMSAIAEANEKIEGDSNSSKL